MNVPEFTTPDPQRLAQILDRLIERSDQGQLSWEEGSPPDSFAADFAPGMRVRVRSHDGAGTPPLVLDIWGPDGSIELQTAIGTDSAVDTRIAGLYARGKKIVADPNKVLRAIEHQLGLDSPAAAPPPSD